MASIITYNTLTNWLTVKFNTPENLTLKLSSRKGYCEDDNNCIMFNQETTLWQLLKKLTLTFDLSGSNLAILTKTLINWLEN